MSENFEGDSYQLYRIARDYYQFDIPQKEIAIRENISRPHVSRLLKKAKECGIVSIEIIKPNSESAQDIGIKLKSATGLKVIEIAQCSEHQFHKPEEISKLLSEFASTNIVKYLIGQKKIGVGIGKTLYSTVKKILPFDLEDAEIIPMVGVANRCSSCMQCNLIVSLLADITKSRGYFTNIPIVVEKSETTSDLFNTRFSELKGHWDSLDIALVGLGEPYLNPKKEFILNEATEAYRRIIAKSKNVGDLLVTYFRKDGSEVIIRNNYLKMSMSLADLSKTKNVICIAGGEDKIQGLYTAIKNKYISGLFTDIYTASKLIESFEKKSEVEKCSI